MRFLHVADLHIGKRMGGMSLADDQRHILQQIKNAACERNVDALLIAGDIYDKASPSAEAVSLLDSFLTEMTQAGVRICAVPGNHDSAERIAYAQDLLSRQGVCFSPVFDGHAECVTFSDEAGLVNVWLLPFLKPGDVRRFFPDESIGDNYTAALRAVIASCKIDSSQRNVAVSHQLVIAGAAGPDRAADEIQLGGVDAVDVSVYDAFDYVALGHVHRAQRVGRDTVRYAGSSLKYSFSDAHFPKSAVLVDVRAKKPGEAAGACVSCELVPLEPLHDVREMSMPLLDLLAYGRKVRNAAEESAGDGSSQHAAGKAEGADGSTGCIADDYLHITLTDEHPQMDALAKIRELFPNVLSLDYQSNVMLGSRKAADKVLDPDELGIFELFAEFYLEQRGRLMDAEQECIAAHIVREVEEEFGRGSNSAARADNEGGKQ